MLLMLSGVYLAGKFIARKAASDRPLDEKKVIIYLTAFAAAVRGGLAPFLDYGVLYHVLLPLILGISIPEAYIAGLVPSFILCNVTVPLYTVPISCVVATKVGRYLK